MATSREAAALVPILERFGVPRDGVLVVHSAIAPLSRRGLRAEAIIEALIDYMRGGNLFMPTMTWRTVTPEQPHWDELGTPSHTGVLTEIFRTRYASGRSIHPTHSVAGLGPAAPLLLSRHHIDNTPVSANSPYGLMRDYEAYVLMIGVGLETVTAIHLPEETVNVDLYVRPAETARLYRCRDRHGTVRQVWAPLAARSRFQSVRAAAHGQAPACHRNDRKLSLHDRLAAQSAASRLRRLDRQSAGDAQRQDAAARQR